MWPSCAAAAAVADHLLPPGHQQLHIREREQLGIGALVHFTTSTSATTICFVVVVVVELLLEAVEDLRLDRVEKLGALVATSAIASGRRRRWPQSWPQSC